MIEFFVITSDKYVHLMGDYIKLFNKYWCLDAMNPITILGYEAFQEELPSNFKFQSLGKQSDFGKYWTNALISYFDNVKSEFVCILLDDLFFIQPTDVEKTFNAFNEIEMEKKFIDKFLLGAIPNSMLKDSQIFTSNTLLINKSVDYRTTLKPAIWRTEYFKKMLKPNYTAWDFEVNNMWESKNDGSVIICHKSVNLTTQINLYDKGKFNHKTYNEKKHLINGNDNEIFTKYMNI